MVPDDLSWSFTGNQDFEHFGSSITVSDHFDTIVIGSPTYRVSAGGFPSIFYINTLIFMLNLVFQMTPAILMMMYRLLAK